MIHNHSFDVEGKTFNIESGRVANQAGGAVLLGVGDTVILANPPFLISAPRQP